MVKAGFWDGRVVFCPLENTAQPMFELSEHKTTVTCIAIDSDEKSLITGTKSGEVILWRNASFDNTLEAQNYSNSWCNFK